MTTVWKARSDEKGGLLLERLLASRGIRDTQEAADFLEPKYEKSHDPLILQDMDQAVARIQKAVSRSEKITIYADYDADAVTAAAVLLRYFQHINYQNIDYYIPDRFAEGYGMNTDAVKILKERGTNLIITVDCGINAVESVDLANTLGVDVLITDHHQLTGDIPKAVAVVNPHRSDDLYPFKDLTGVGVAFKLVQALQDVIASDPELVEGERGNLTGIASFAVAPRNDKVARGWEKWLLDLVAIGTVADCQSLLGENRIFVKWGLTVLKKTRWIGLKELIKIADIFGRDFNSYHIGFVIAPRINAAGRIEHANLALELLLTDDVAYASELAEKLDKLNQHRQQLTESVLSEAREQMTLSSDKKILLAAGAGWPKGVVGLVAGKLTQEFNRPVLVLEKSEGEATGSARSIANFNIIEAISQSREILLKYGGHPQAAGFTLKTEHIELFHKQLLLHADEVLGDDDLSPVLHYDAKIILADIDDQLLQSLENFAPFGQGNPVPRFRLNNLRPSYASRIGKDGKHLRFYLGPASEADGSESQKIGCVGFNLGFWAEKLLSAGPIDVICEPQYNDWNGERKIQLKIIDLSLHPSLSPGEGISLPK